MGEGEVGGGTERGGEISSASSTKHTLRLAGTPQATRRDTTIVASTHAGKEGRRRMHACPHLSSVLSPLITLSSITIPPPLGFAIRAFPALEHRLLLRPLLCLVPLRLSLSLPLSLRLFWSPSSPVVFASFICVFVSVREALLPISASGGSSPS